MIGFPSKKQYDAKDCGPTCLLNIAEYYGQSYSMDQLREKCHISKRGVSLLGVSEGAESIGFRTIGAKLTWNQLQEEAPLPCIIHWKQNHFVVLYKIKTRWSLFHKRKISSNEVFISDPAHGLVKYSKGEFLESWISSKENNVATGIVLLLEPTPEFYSEKIHNKESKFGFTNLWNYLHPHSRYLFMIFFSMLIGSIISLIFPFLTKSIVDYGIGNRDLHFISIILIAQIFLSLGSTSNNFIRSWLMLHVTSRVSISLVSDFLSKLMKLPIAFFDTRLVGDIMQRVRDHGRIQTFLTSSLISIIFSSITLIVYSFIMAYFHLGILLVFFGGSLVYIIWILLFLRKRRNLDYKYFRESSRNQSKLVQLISGIQEIKLNSCEKQKRWEWERIQASLFKVNIKSLVLNQRQQAGATFINQGKNFVITFLSAKAVIDGNMTLGTMMAVQYILGQLNSPIQDFIGFIQSIQDTNISLERLGEIQNKKDEEQLSADKIKLIPAGKDLQIRNLDFQYGGSYSDRVLNNITLDIPARKITAIVGVSGSGKTTLMKLLLKFYSPTSGSITIDGKSLEQYSDKFWREKCGVVMQEGFIFSDSIANNIGTIDDQPDIERLERAAEIANIKEFIASLPNGFNTKIGSEGHGLSSGQKQRILIARSIYKDPDFIFFDEATNALDANNERDIIDKLHDFFINKTVIIIAHRLSTVMKADQIVVLDNGSVAEIGDHHDLLYKRGIYYNLVKNQLDLVE